jgi:tripartite-type tricarboxylate transporter receptor subunit TctC
VPTIASAGYPGFEVVAWVGAAAPAHTPAAVIDKLNAGFKQALDDPGIRAKLTSQGWDVEPSTPQALDQFIRSEIERYRPIVREANMHAD